MKNGRSLSDLAVELERQLGSKQDFVVPSSLLRCSTAEDGVLSMSITGGGVESEFGVSELARRQLADKLRIPFAYFERMRTERPELLDRNVNTWLVANGDRRMIRTLDGQVRAVLSDRYRRLDNHDLAEAVLPILQRLPGATFESVELTQTRMYLKVVTSRIQEEIVPGDAVQAGVMITNSEVGEGTLSVQPLVFRLVCRNGLIVPDRGLRKTHMGRSLATDSQPVAVFRDDTLAADDRAFFMKVRDVVESAVSEAAGSAGSFRQVVDRMRQVRGIPLSGDPVMAVAILANRYGLNDTERGGVLRHLIREGDLSGYGVVNAVTHYSQEVEDYDRATELEALGGKLIELGSGEWQEIAEAA